MSEPRLSKTILGLQRLAAPLYEFFLSTRQELQDAGEEACDFLAGNPQEPALEGYPEVLQRWSAPRSRDWFAYKVSEPGAQAAAAASLRRRLNLPFEDQDIALTNAAIAALAAALRAVADAGDEVMLISPPHFLYEPLIVATGATAVSVRVRPDTFDLDVDAVTAALTPRTRAVILNTPHNPTGRIFPPESLESLAAALSEASDKWGPVYLLSDEAYNRILFDGRPFWSPAAFYSNTMLIYSYGKQLLAPGQRIGYVALAPTMPARQAMREAIATAQLASGYLFPNALLQHALPDLEEMQVDLVRLQAKRDRMVDGLRTAGYELHVPEATFYLLVRSPDADDRAFTRELARRNVFVMPGSMLEMPGYFRISLTATEDMIERALPAFERAMAAAARSA